jgi:transposase
MAMGAVKGQAATLQVEMVCLDELVPEADRYRGLDRLVDWSFVRELAAPYYVEEIGRPSIDPIVLVKLMVAGALEGIGSTRELLRQASMRLDLRRFLGYGLGERLPVHQTLSHAHTRRFVDAALFERLFLRSLELCRQHGLVEGTHVSIDGFHAEADAALASLRASLALAAAPEAEAGEPGEGGEPLPAGQLAIAEQASGGRPGGERPGLTLAEPRSGATPKRRSSNQRSVSVTDPEAKLRGKPGQRPHLIYRGQVAVDRKQRVIVACRGEEADGFEGDAVEPLLDRARFACPELASIGADSGFAAERVWRAAQQRGLPSPTSRRSRRCCQNRASRLRPRRSVRPWRHGHAARARPGSRRTAVGWRTPRASSANSRTRVRPTAPSAGADRTSTSNSSSTAPQSTASGSLLTLRRRKPESQPPPGSRTCRYRLPPPTKASGSPRSSPPLAASGTTASRSTEPALMLSPPSWTGP